MPFAKLAQAVPVQAGVGSNNLVRFLPAPLTAALVVLCAFWAAGIGVSLAMLGSWLARNWEALP